MPVKMARDGITHAINDERTPPGAFKHTLCNKMYTGDEKKARRFGYGTRYEGSPHLAIAVNTPPTCLWCAAKLR